MADKDEIFGGFIDNLDKPEKPPKEGLFAKLFGGKKAKPAKNQGSDDSDSFYNDSMDFLASDDSGSPYDETGSSSSRSGSEEDFVPTLKNLFGFKWWEFSVIIIEFFLIIYMVLVLLKVVPLF